MSIFRSLAAAFGLGLFLSVAGSPIFAQGTTTGGTTTTTGGTTTTTGGGGGGGGNAGSTANASPATEKGPTSGAGSTTSIPSNSNPFVQTYVDYLALGNPKLFANTPVTSPPKITSSTFGKPIYGNVATTNTGGGGTGTATTAATGFTTMGIIRAPSYVTGLSDEVPYVVHQAPTLLADARAIINRSSFINNKEHIEILMDGNAIVLRGLVGTEKERRTAESLLILTPGMRDVRNELRVEPTLARR